MNKTQIEWVKNPDGSQGYTCSDKTGCLNQVDGRCLGGGFPCYAYRLADTRLRDRYLANHNVPSTVLAGENTLIQEAELTRRLADPFYPRFWPERLEQIRKRKKPAGIFLNDMSDWMGDYWPDGWTEMELHVMRDCPQHRFYTLTKQPQNLTRFSPFPDNCWVGVTITNGMKAIEEERNPLAYLKKVQAKVKYISFEPLLSLWDTELFNCVGRLAEAFSKSGINQVIIGSQTKPSVMPRIEWVEEIVRACDKAGIPVFLKDNLKPLVWNEKERVLTPDWARMQGPYDGLGGFLLRQELPGGDE